MILIQKGERGPRAILAQILLNRNGADPKLVVDGIWGKNTETAVQAFRSSIGRDPRGGIDGDVWQVLIAGEGLHVVDSVDVSAIPYKGRDGKDHVLESDYGTVFADDIEAGGGHPLRLNRKVGKGVEDAIQRIITDVGNDNQIALLRFQGHGNHGTWFTIEAGDPVDLKGLDTKAFKELAADWHGYLDIHNFDKHKLTLAKLKPYFAPFGCVEHHGCRVGAHSQGLLQKLANLWNVPVSAGKPDQFAGGESSYVFEGSVFTAYPGHQSMKAWAKNVAE